MAFVAVSSLMQTIEFEFLQPNPRFVVQNKELIISMHQKLEHFLGLLEESEKKADNCEDMRDLMARIREVMFKAEDEIEAAILVVLDETEMLSRARASLFYNEPETTAPSSSSSSSSLFPLAQCPKTLDETFRNVLHCVQELMDNLQKTRSTRSGDSSLVLHMDNISNPQSSKLDEDAMVGHSTQLEEVMAHIFRPSLQRRQVIAIVGMGGIGKTTFARTIYNDPRVASHFYLRGWTTVSQQHNATQMFLELCRSIRSMPDDTNLISADELAAHLRRSLLGQRYLIIVDDIWTEKAWDEIQRCFPDENNGSRILLTTRHKEVAEYADAGEYSFNMRFLDSNEGWELFYQKLQVKEPLNKEFETVGKNIVKKCRGLPLAIVLLAGLLSASNKSFDKWKNLGREINWLVALDIGEQFYSRIFSLSYNSLPNYLKGCFLYLGAFPEDTEIPTKNLIRLWIAEGLIKTMSDKKRLEELGESYLHDLINRSLVMISGQSFDGKIKTCKIHDLLHDLCVNKIKKDKLLYVHHHNNDNNWIYGREVNPCFGFRGTYSMFNFGPSVMRVRSIFSYSSTLSYFNLLTNSLKRLRVLDLSFLPPVRSMPNDIVDLVFLRYLALTSNRLLCGITLWRNWNLQTLTIRDSFPVNRPSRWIWELPRLRHLECHYEVPINPPKVVQENFQTFYWLYDIFCTNQVLLSIPNVRELGIFTRAGEQFHRIDNLYLLNHLEKLTIQGPHRHPSLKLPPHAHAFPLNLNKLTIRSITLEWEDITQVVSMLPNLEVLKLKDNIYEGQEWELTEEKGFPRLKVLLISSSRLREWKASDIDDPFPVLERLLMRDCDELKEMPDWIEGIHTLQLMQLDECRQSLVNSAKKIQQERQSYGDDGLVIKESRTQINVLR